MQNKNNKDESTYRRSSVKQILEMLEQQIQSTSKALPTRAASSEIQASNSTLKMKSISQDELASIGSDSRSSLASSRFPPIPIKPQALRSGSIEKKYSISELETRKSICRPSLTDNNNSLAEVSSTESLFTETKTLPIPIKENDVSSSSKMLHPKKHEGLVEGMDSLRIAPSTKEMEFDDFNHQSSDSVKGNGQKARIHKLKHISQSFVRAKHQPLIPVRKPIPFLTDCLITAQEAKKIMRNDQIVCPFEPLKESGKSSPKRDFNLPMSKVDKLPVSPKITERTPIVLTFNKSTLPIRIDKTETRNGEIIFQKIDNITSASADVKNGHVKQIKIHQQIKSSHTNIESKKKHENPEENRNLSSLKEMSYRGFFEPYYFN